MKKLLAGGVIIMSLFVALSLYYSSIEKLDPLSKQAIDSEIAERYEELYKEHYKVDEEKVRMLESSLMEERVQSQLEDVRAGYWAKAKEETLGGVAEYVEASPEVVSFLVDFEELESQKYSSLDDFFIKNYPTSRFIGYDLRGQCQKNNISDERCLLLLAIAGKESGFDTAYVMNDRTVAVSEGKARNNPFGLKANRRYIDTKCGEDIPCRGKYQSIPYDGFAFVDFNTWESGLDWFMNDTLAKGYPRVTNPYQMIGYFNSNPKWADDVSHFIKILRPLYNNN